MKEDIKEYYPNGRLKHVIRYYANGSIYAEMFYDEDGLYHREDGLPDYCEWYENGISEIITYCVHGEYHDINSPAYICFHRNGKIKWKLYFLNHKQITKLNCQNQIKKIF